MSGGDQPAAQQSPFKDQTAGLVIFGVLQILLGGFFALMIPLMSLAMLTPQPNGGATLSVGTVIPAVGIYAMLAVLLVSLGIGSIRARRWARALTLTLASVSLVSGVVTLTMMMLWMPQLLDLMQRQGENGIPPQAMMLVQVVMFGSLGCFYVVLPGMFVIFYRRAAVKATCEYKDAQVRWTDKCPLPVLAISLLMGFGVFSFLFSIGYGFVMPFFGMILKGLPGALVILGLSIVFGYLAWGMYKLKMTAWWTAMAVYLVGAASTIYTFARIDILEMYREMDMVPDDQLRMMEESGIFESMNIPLMTGVSFAVLILYMIWLRRFFVAGPGT